MKIDPFSTPGLLPAERLVLAALAANPDATPHRLADLTGIEPAIITRTLRELKKRKLWPPQVAA